MNESIQSPTSYLDFSGLGRLRGKAHIDETSAARETGQQFEAMFIQMMMKSMRDATPKSEFLQSDAMDSYQDLCDKEISTKMAKRGALGIGDMLTTSIERFKQARVDSETRLEKDDGKTTPPPGFPLIKTQEPVSLQKPDRVLSISRPHEGGYSLNRSTPATVEPVQDAKE